MPKAMKTAAMVSLTAAILSGVMLYRFAWDTWLTLTITFGTIAYHFIMRLLVGWIFSLVMKNRADYTRKWYQLRPWEQKLYRFLRVKKWKNRLPTYVPESFSKQEHAWEEIAQTMCQAELIHETNALLSFAPLAASIWFGSLAAFLITSLAGAAFDLLFVIVQRYNRDRAVRLCRRQEKAGYAGETVRDKDLV